MQRKLEQREFGKTRDGKPVQIYVLTNPNGLTAKITNYGAILTELHTPDRTGQPANIVLGFEVLEEYLKGHPGFGATIGRFANRIARAEFVLDGKTYHLPANHGRHHLHGVFDKQVWDATPSGGDAADPSVRFRYVSPDGEEGYPGSVEVTVIYTLTGDNELRIEYSARSDQATPINLTNHSYFNLAGSGDVLEHIVTLAADCYTPVDDELIPTGEIAGVAGTPLDFREPMAVGARIQQLKPKPGGYDHNYVLNSGGGKLSFAARVYEPRTGRRFETFTTEPGVQFYTGNFLDGQRTGTGGVVYGQHSGLCLETQHFPDSVHHSNFPSTILRPGARLESITVYRFSTQ